MKKLIFILMALICTQFNFDKLYSNVSALENSTSQPNNSINTLEFNDNNYYLNINNVKNFSIIENNILLLKDNNVTCFNKTTKQTLPLPFNNVSQIEQTENYFFILNDKLNIINKNLETITIPDFNISCNLFNVYENNEFIYIAYIQNNIYNYLTIKKQTMTIYSHFTDKTMADKIIINNPLTMCIDENSSYIIYNNDNLQNILLTIDNQKNFSTKEDKTLTYLHSSNLELLHYNNNEYFILTHNKENALTIIDKTNLKMLTEKEVKGFTEPSFNLGNILNFTDVKIINNEIYILDSSIGAIQKFNLIENQLLAKNIVITSKSYELGRFNNVTNIQVIANNEFIIANQNNNRIENCSNNICNKIYVKNINLENPKKIITSNNINFYIQLNNKILISKKDFATNNLEVVNTVSQENIIDIDLNENNELYVLTKNAILKYDEKTQTTTKIIDYEFLTNSKIKVFKDIIIASKNNNLLMFNNNYQLFKTINNTLNIISIDIDFDNNIYLLSDNQISKIELANNEYQILRTINLNKNNITTFAINKIDGSFILFDNYNCCFYKLNNTLTNNLLNYNHEIDAYSKIANNEIYKLAQLNNDCYITTYPNNVNFTDALTKNSFVYILNKNLNNKFYYCLYSKNNYINFGYIEKNNLTILEYSIADEISIEPIFNEINIYKYPTSLNTNNNENFIIKTAQQNSILKTINTEIKSLDNTLKYYAILLDDNSIGYVNCSDVILFDENKIKQLPNPNAKIYTTANKINLYEQDNHNSPILLKLNNNAKIYVANYDTKQEFTKIIFVDKNKCEHIGYIETKYIVLTNNNPSYISAYILLGISILLIMGGSIIYLIEKKHRK